MRKLLELFWFYWFPIDQNITPTYWPHWAVVTTSMWSETRRSWSDDSHGDHESDSERWSVRDNSLFTHQHLTKWPIMITWFDYTPRKMLKPMTKWIFPEAQFFYRHQISVIEVLNNCFFRFSRSKNSIVFKCQNVTKLKTLNSRDQNLYQQQKSVKDCVVVFTFLKT